MQYFNIGENGTGKDLIAKAIHQHSLRADKPFVKVDVGALNRITCLKVNYSVIKKELLQMQEKTGSGDLKVQMEALYFSMKSEILLYHNRQNC